MDIVKIIRNIRNLKIFLKSQIPINGTLKQQLKLQGKNIIKVDESSESEGEEDLWDLDNEDLELKSNISGSFISQTH